MKTADVRLSAKTEIIKALQDGAPVYADCPDLPERLPVKDVKLSQGLLKVRIMEGWRTPFHVYISHPTIKRL